MKKSVLWTIASLLAVILLSCCGAQADVKTWTLSKDSPLVSFEMTSFDTELPGGLASAVRKTRWTDWQCLKGLSWVQESKETGAAVGGAAIAAFVKEQQTILLQFGSDDGENWTCVPAAEEKALLAGRAFSFDAIADGMPPTIRMVYPVSGGGREIFDLVVSWDSRWPARVTGYRHEFGDGSAVSIGGGRFQTEYFRVEKIEAGGEATLVEVVPYFYPNALESFDAEHYPKTLEEVHRFVTENPQTFPQGYGILLNVNMREKASSQSKKLGVYHGGTLVKVLGTEPGKSDPWYKVQVGQTVGYISGPYLRTDEVVLFGYYSGPMSVGKTSKACDLKAAPSSLSDTVAAIKAETEMYVLADCDGWLHVCIPLDGLGIRMEEEGTYGYLPAEEVIEAATPLRLKYTGEN